MRNIKGDNLKQKYVLIFFGTITYRILIYGVSALIMAFRTTEVALSLDTFLANWCKWDANHYIKIATLGYQGAVEFCETCRNAKLATGISPEYMESGQHLMLVFFPFYSFVLRLMHLCISDIRIAGMLVSTIAYAGGCVNIYRLVKLDYSEKAAINSIILVSLFPFGFFFGGIMTEGLFLFLSASMLYYIRKHEWWKVILFGIFATMTRMQGALLIVPAVVELLMLYPPYEAIKTRNFSNIKDLVKKGCSLLFMFIGTGIYLFINWYVEGYPFTFMIYQKAHWHQGACLPTYTLSYIFKNAFSDTYSLQLRVSLWMPQALIFIFSVGILLYGIKKLRAYLMSYAIVYVLLTYSATWLLSAGRYMSCGIPIFIGLALLSEKKEWIKDVLIVVFAMLQIVYLFGYFNNMQIM